MAEYKTDTESHKILVNSKAQTKIDEVLNLKNKYEQSTQLQRREWKKYHDAIEGRFHGVPIPFQSKYFVPKISTAVSVLTPVVIGNFPTFRTLPVGTEDIPGSEAMEKIMKFQADYELDLYNKVSSWVSQGALLGTSYMYVPWVVRKDRNDKKIFDNIELEVASPFDIYSNPTVPSVEDLEERNLPLIARFWGTVKDIESNPLYKNKITLPITKDLRESENVGDNSYNNSDILNMQKFSEDKYLYTDVNKVIIYYYWTKEWLRVVARGKEKHLLFDGPNPWKMIPYADFKWEVDPNPQRAHGRGVGKQGMDIQDMYNKVFNQLVDNVRNSANQMYQRRRGARIDPRQLITRPSGFVDVDEIDKDLALIDNKYEFNGILELLNMIDQQFQIATANTDVVQGIAGADSASEAIILNRNTALRLDMIRKNFAKALQRLGRLIMRQDLNNITDLKVIKIFNKEVAKFEVQKISRDQFKGHYDVQVEPDESLMTNRDIFRKQLLDLYNLTAQDPESRIKKTELIKEITKGGVKDVDKFFQTEEEFQATRERAMEDSLGVPGGLGGALAGQKLPAPENGLTDRGTAQTTNAQNSGFAPGSGF